MKLRHVFIASALAVIAYVLLWTPVGTVIAYSGVVEIARTMARPQTVKAVCEFGNGLIDRFQPLASDDQFIEHLNKHRPALLRLVEMEKTGQAVKPEGGLTETLKAALAEAEVEHVSSGGLAPPAQGICDHARGCANKIIKIFPKSLRTTTHYHCAARRTVFKSLVNIPGYTEVVGDRLRIGQERGAPSADYSLAVVADTDPVSRHRCAVRRLERNWFIQVC